MLGCHHSLCWRRYLVRLFLKIVGYANSKRAAQPRAPVLSKTKTFLSLGADLFTWFVFRAARLLRGRPRAQRAIATLVGRVRLGSDRAAISVEVFGRKEVRPASAAVTCEGRREAAMTAQVAALVVEHLMMNEVPNSVHHIEQIIDPEQAFVALAARGVNVTFR